MFLITKLIRGRVRVLIIVAAISSILSGLSRAALIKLLNDALTHNHFNVKLYIALCLAGPACSVAGELAGSFAINDLMHAVLLELAKQIVKIPLQRVEEVGNHRIFSVLTEDSYLITGSLKLLPNIVVQSSMILGCSIYLAALSLRAFFCLIVLIGIGALSFQLTHRLGQRYMKLARHCADNIVRHVQYLTGNFKELQLHSTTRDRYFNEGLSQAANSYRRPTIIGTGIYSLNANVNHVLFFAAMGIMLFMAPRWLAHSSTGLVTGYGLALLFLIGPVTSLSTLLAGLGSIGAAIQHITELGLTLQPGAGKHETAPETTGCLLEQIVLDRITHRYDSGPEGAQFSVGPVSLTLVPGQIIFIVGGNGSGKTTVAKMCCGLYPLGEGEVWWNGRKVDSSNVADYRELFAVVFSDIYLFERPFNVPRSALAGDAQRLLTQFDLSDVNMQHGTLSTISLSRGQQKRLALALAMLEDRPIYLLDEWAADQDPHFRRLFYQQILPDLRHKGKCVIVISHDDSYFDVADILVRMDHGSVANITTLTKPFGISEDLEHSPVSLRTQEPSQQ